MRGALNSFDGIEIVDLVPGKKSFDVKYDSRSVSPEALAAAINKTKEQVVIK